MKIGFLADKIPYRARRGWGIYSHQLLKALLSIDDKNIYRCFYSIFRKGQRDLVLRAENANLQNRIWPLPGRMMELMWERWRLLPAESFLGEIDVLHVPYEFLPKVRSARTIVTVHDVTFLRYPEHLDPAFVKLFTRRIYEIVERADRIIADSQNTKKELVNFAAAPEERIVIIPLGVDDRFKPTEDATKITEVTRRYGISYPYVLFVGAADEDKNLVRLAKAFAQVRREQKHVQLVFAGKDEWGFDRLVQQLRGMNIEEGIIRTGFVSAADLPFLYAGAEILAMPSIHEGFGLPALEAMACGTAVLCSNTASLPEVVGDAGWQVDPYSVEAIFDGLRSLLKDDELRSRCIMKGIERAKYFTWEATATKVLDIYRELNDE